MHADSRPHTMADAMKEGIAVDLPELCQRAADSRLAHAELRRRCTDAPVLVDADQNGYQIEVEGSSHRESIAVSDIRYLRFAIEDTAVLAYRHAPKHCVRRHT